MAIREELLNRDQAVGLVGEGVIERLDSEDVDFTGSCRSDGDVEFSASVSAMDNDGNEVTVTAYCYVDENVVQTTDLDAIRWKIEGYDVS